MLFACILLGLQGLVYTARFGVVLQQITAGHPDRGPVNAIIAAAMSAANFAGLAALLLL